MPDYGSAAYWDERYAADEHGEFDWYQTYDSLQPYISSFLRNSTEFEILVPGCGNSRLSTDLYDNGFTNITSIDISPVVIQQMNERFTDREMEYIVMDATNMEVLPNECFDLVLDKALMDSILCGDDSFRKVQLMVGEMHRVLKPGGVLILCSYGLPATRMGYFKNAGFDWTMNFIKIPKPELQTYKEEGAGPDHYLYICKKNE